MLASIVMRVIVFIVLLVSNAAPAPELKPEPIDPRIPLVQTILKGRPLEPYAAEMLQASDAFGLDWWLLPATSVAESGGGENTCGGNAWGWDSCIHDYAWWWTPDGLPDFHYGIWFIADTFANGRYYAGLDSDAKLCVWVSGHGCWGDHALGYLARIHSQLP